MDLVLADVTRTEPQPSGSMAIEPDVLAVCSALAKGSCELCPALVGAMVHYHLCSALWRQLGILQQQLQQQWQSVQPSGAAA